MGKVVMVLYQGGKWAEKEPRLFGTVENALGLKDWIKEQGHELVVTDDKEGPNSELAKHAKDAEVIITTPFHPGYITKELIDSAKNLKVCATAGVGSDHVDLDAANTKKIGVYEVTGSNVVSVAEHVVMTILLLVRNYNVGHHIATIDKRWDIARVASNAYDLEGKVVGTLGAGRIGFRVLQRLKPFDCKELLYYDYTPLPEHAAKEVGARRVEDLNEFLGQLDVLTINAPLHEGTRGLINKETLKHLKKGAWIINTARGAICVAEDVAEAVNSGQINAYGGDVWPKQPAPADQPWRTMHSPNDEQAGNGMVPHYSGTTLDAQKRYADGVKEILSNYWAGKPQKDINVIVENGDYVSKAYGQRDSKSASTASKSGSPKS